MAQTAFEWDEITAVRCLSVEAATERAIKLLQWQEPAGGYYLCFSGGKDSIVCKHLLKMAGVRFESYYNNTTIDPPELIRFIKKHHPDVKWNQSRYGNFFHCLATAPKSPPTRRARWCCERYKEYGGRGRVKVFGVRAAESPARRARWAEITRDRFNDTAICPIVYWSDEQVWGFIRAHRLPYCSLYDEGIARIGCIGCPLAGRSTQEREFARWPRYRELWRKAIIQNWERWHDVPRRDGSSRYQSKFRSGEEMWEWWLNMKSPDAMHVDCQQLTLWTNVDELEP